MLPVNWKGSVVWSGATALATWMAAAPPVVAPGGGLPAAATAAVAPAETAAQAPILDLTEEAERLARRIAEQQAYAPPTRDPFQFSAPSVERAVARAPVSAVSAPAAAATSPAPAPVPFTLIGMAEDGQGPDVVRTAVISGPSGAMWLAKAGETVDGQFTVTAVDAGGVDLLRADTGTALRLTIRP